MHHNNRTATLTKIKIGSNRNLTEGGFGMATITNKISLKIDNDLQEKFSEYLSKYDSDKSKVLRTALKEYLDKRMSPVENKTKSAK